MTKIAVFWMFMLLTGFAFMSCGQDIPVERAPTDPFPSIAPAGGREPASATLPPTIVQPEGRELASATPPLASVQPGGLVPAFPGAEGFGAQALADCDKTDIKVIEVTNLNSSGPGSFQDAIQNQLRDGKLDIIIFRTGGTINGRVGPINRSCVYIAGQTAPGDGVQVRHSHTVLATDRSGNGNNIVIRYLRMRTDKGTPGKGDVMSVTGGHDIIIDHVSVQWGNDENLSFNPTAISGGGTEVRDFTLQRSIIAEGLFIHSTGSIVGSDNPAANTGSPRPATYNGSIHHNIYAHNSGRNPSGTSQDVQIANNVVYNWRNVASTQTQNSSWDFVNNWYARGAWSNATWFEQEMCNRTNEPPYDPFTPTPYISGNIFNNPGEDRTTPNSDQWSFIRHAFTCAGNTYVRGEELPASWQRSTPISGNTYIRREELPASWQRSTPISDASIPVTLQSALEARDSVLADAGANKRLACDGSWVGTQDRVDADISNHIQNRTVPFILTEEKKQSTSPSDYGGFPSLAPGFPCPDRDSDGIPDEWETRYYGSPTGAPAISTMAAGGYTVIEHYLNGTDPLVDGRR